MIPQKSVSPLINKIGVKTGNMSFFATLTEYQDILSGFWSRNPAFYYVKKTVLAMEFFNIE